MTARTVLVTGGAKRIGAAISARLAKAGWRVVIHYRLPADDARALADRIGGQTIDADLADPAAAAALPARTAALLQAPLDAVVNNASVFEYNTAESFTVEDWSRDQAVNLLAPVLIARSFARLVEPGRMGAVVNMLDQKLWNLNADFFSYTISKIGLEGATRMLARALAPSVRVNAVAPGLVLPSGNQTEEEFRAVAGKYNLMQRPIDIDAIAGAVRFLLENTAMTGCTLLADNGQHMVASDHDIMFSTRGHQ
ncbi:MAG: SDR family oxidoreductase [Parvularculaceae bacterium]